MQSIQLSEVMKFVPSVGSGDYLAKTKTGRCKGFALRKGLLKFAVEVVQRLAAIETTSLFLSELFDVNFSLKVKHVFLRLYDSETESRGLAWHVDGALATIVITMPSPAFCHDNESRFEVIDPSHVRDKTFLASYCDAHQFSSSCELLKEKEEGVFSFDLNVFDFLIMANPVPHRVSPIKKGDRISIVFFLDV